MAAKGKTHVVLLGDSIFDNSTYVSGGPDVRQQLQDCLPEGWQVTLLAVDGDSIHDIAEQLKRLPLDASHLVVSVGGNDALAQMGVLGDKVQTISDALTHMAEVSEPFRRDYHDMLQVVLKRNLPTALCTVYYPRFPDSALQRLAVTGLAPFNDSIIVEAFRAGLPLLDLRLICDDDGDYANPIEPSTKGGAKIAGAIATLVLEHDFGRGRTEVFTGRQ